MLRHVNLKNIDVSAQEVLKCRTDKPKKVIGMTESEMNLLSTLPFEYISEVVNPAEEYNSDIQLENVLSDECIKILDDICIALQNVDKNKWQDATRTSIFPSLLANKDKLLSDCRHTELNCIADVIKSYTECIMFVRTDNKMKKINVIVQLFGSNNFFVLPEKQNKLCTLKQLCLDEVEKFLTVVLQVVYAKAVHVCNSALWKK